MEHIENQNLALNTEGKEIATETSPIPAQAPEVCPQSGEAEKNDKIDGYLCAYIHALTCTDAKCARDKCGQFKRAIQHSKQCQKYQKCKFCYQLIALSCYHSKQCSDKNCLVPFCISIKMKLNSIVEMKKVKKFLAENADAYAKIYAEPRVSSHTQTSRLEMRRKRSHDELSECEEEGTSESQEILDENAQKAEFIARLASIQETHRTSPPLPKTPSRLHNKILPNQRKDLVNFVFELSLAKQADLKSAHFARFALFLIRKEQEIHESLRDFDEYLYLLGDLAFRAKFEVDKWTSTDKRDSQTQVNVNEFGDETISDESASANKKIKLN